MRPAIIVLAVLLASQPAQNPPSPLESFRLYFIGHEIGREDVTHQLLDDDVRRIVSTFHYEDRGTPIDLKGELDLEKDGTARRLRVTGKTYRYFASDIDYSVVNGRASLREGGVDPTTSWDVPPGTVSFPLDSYAPIAVHEAMLAYWMSHGRPAVLQTAPAGSVRITSRGSKVMNLGNSISVQVERLSIEGAVWGTETAWIVPPNQRHLAGRLIGLVTWAGALPFAAVRGDIHLTLDTLRAEANADRFADLEALARQTPPQRTGSFALVGAAVIDGVSAAPIANGTIVVRDGRIAAVGPSASTPVPRGFAVVDAKGQFIIPGLWDMHAHASQVDWAPIYLAGGVTTIRDMGGEADFLKAFRDAIASGAALGPRMLLAGLVDGSGPRAFGAVYADTPDEGRAVVRRYKDMGFEQMKIYSLVKPDVVRAIAEEAHARGMLVTGHVPSGMTARQAVEAGFDHIAHMPLRGSADDPETRANIDFFVKHGTTIDPIPSWGEYLGRAAETPIESFQPGYLNLAPPLKRMIGNADVRSGNPAQIRERQLQTLRLIKAARDAGIPVVAGTDKGVPGFSVQRELELYVDGGMTPLEALQTATIVPARVMKLDRDTGSIEAGKRADLV
ncbi:MAG TPA: amidohydrolase family protein, partial [Vicinamibacterales bacterium]|nr:amidohydrolase family protein [Vicinamibacterales bacterium]